jgi:hypothetical protein
MSEAWLTGLLDEAAEAYEPDTERLRALVDARIDAARQQRSPARRGRAARPTRRLAVLGRLGLAGIPAGVALAAIGGAAALAVGVTATLAVTSNHDTSTGVGVLTPHGGGSGGPTASQSTLTSAGATSPVGGATGNAGAGTGTAAHSPSAPAASGSATATATGTGGTNALFSTSAIAQTGNPVWAELDVWVTAKQPLTSLTITVKVAACHGLGSTDIWSSAAGGSFKLAETSNGDGSLTYTFTLDQGNTFAPSAQGPEFSAQFNHAAGVWAAASDTFSVAARTAGATADTVVDGRF